MPGLVWPAGRVEFTAVCPACHGVHPWQSVLHTPAPGRPNTYWTDTQPAPCPRKDQP